MSWVSMANRKGGIIMSEKALLERIEELERQLMELRDIEAKIDP